MVLGTNKLGLLHFGHLFRSSYSTVPQEVELASSFDSAGQLPMAVLEGSESAVAEMSPDNKLRDYGEMSDASEMEGLSLYEKKAMLVNRELDSHGMGKYQWYAINLVGGCTVSES